MHIDTPLLIVGGGPGALAVAEIASGHRLPSLVVGHVPGTGPAPDMPVALDADAVAALSPNGVLGVLRPYLAVSDPPTLSPRVFEQVLKQHGVADMNVTIYDGLDVVELTVPGAGGDSGDDTGEQVGDHTARYGGAISDGSRRWTFSADAVIDTGAFPPHLSDAVNRAAAEVRLVLERAAGR